MITPTMKYLLQNIIAGLIAGMVGAVIVGQTSIPENGLFNANRLGIKQGEDSLNQPTVFKAASAHEQQVISAVQKASPAVVSVLISKDVPIIERFFDNTPNTPNDPFGDFFGNNFFSPWQLRVPQLRQRGTEKREVGGGSGFIVSADGYIVTNRHVVADEDADYTVFTNDGKKYDAKVIARDPSNDISVLKIDAVNLPSLSFTDSDNLQVGQTVIAIGNALSEFRNTVSTGVISGLSRTIIAGDGRGSSESLDEVIQTDAAINPGNSGGPLLNLSGDVLGVNVAVALGSENIGFALPANVVSTTVDAVKKDGKIVRPYLGVRYVAVTPAIAEQNKLPVDYGALVVRGDTPESLAVLPGSPADKAGLVEGDIILEFNGTKINDDKSLASIIRSKKVGDTITIKLLHQGNEKNVSLTLAELPQ